MWKLCSVSVVNNWVKIKRRNQNTVSSCYSTASYDMILHTTTHILGGVGLLNQFPPFCYFFIFLWIIISWLIIEYHIQALSKIENINDGEIYEQSFGKVANYSTHNRHNASCLLACLMWEKLHIVITALCQELTVLCLVLLRYVKEEEKK